jgi:xylulokinase
MPLVGGVDSSTQATKVEVRDSDSGRLVASGRAAHPPTQPPKSEQDPLSWSDAFAAAWAQCGSPEVASISVAAQQHGLVVCDEKGQPLRPAKLWNDTESAPDAGWLVKQFGGPEAWAEAVGTVPVASLTISKLSWLHRSEPETFERMARLLLPHDWLTFQLCGEYVTDRGDASGTGYWSPSSGTWRFDLLEIVDKDEKWPLMLPRVLAPTEPAGEWEGGAVVGPGTGDNMAAALGLGLRPGDVAVSLGTSGTVFAVSERPTADPTGAVAGFADATGRFLPLVCTMNATRASDAVARLLAVDREGLDRLALDAQPGAGGVVLVPYFDGERTPNRPEATGTLAGLRSEVSREQVARAAFEGVVCGLLDGLDALSAAGVDVSGRLFLVGGGARSAAYRRIVADLTQRPVIVPDDPEAVATGACVQAAAVLDSRSFDELASDWDLGRGTLVEPDPSVDVEAVRAAYAAVRDRPC